MKSPEKRPEKPPLSHAPAAVAGPVVALGLMALGATLFALMNFFARLATASASWASAAAVRSLVGAFIAYAVARARGASLAAKDKRALFWRSLLGTISMMSTFYVLSSRTVSLGNTVTLLNLAPVFLAVLAPIFLHERTSAALAFAILVSLSGVVLVVRPAFLFGASVVNAEDVLPPHALEAAVAGPSVTTTLCVAVLAAFATSIAMMMLRRVGQTETPESIAFHFSLFAAATMSVIALFDLRMPSLRDALLMVIAGLCAGFGQLAMTRAYSLENAARVSGMSYLSVVASALLGSAVLGERPSTTAVLGMMLVIAGGLLITFARSARSTASFSRINNP
jgi:drug/metabolite transporter (DMT)-like permease